MNAKKRVKRVFTPFKETSGRCTGQDEDDFTVIQDTPSGLTKDECRLKCEMLGEKCNAFTWGPNLTGEDG